MDVKLHNTGFKEEFNGFDENSGYYLISLKWSLINDEFITFVRKGALAYCYNLTWAGPMSKFEAERLDKKNKTVMVHLSLIKPFLKNVCSEEKEVFMLPNTDEVRKIIGFNDGDLQHAM